MLARELDELEVIEVIDLLFANVRLERREGRYLVASGWFPYSTQIGYGKVNRVIETVQLGHRRSGWRKPLIDQSLGLARPFRVQSRREGRVARGSHLSV